MKNFNITQIGVIHSPYKTKQQCPIQGMTAPDSTGEIEIYPEYKDGLKTIELFSHIILFYIFDQAGEVILCRKPFLDDTPHGVFASRHPCRPNGIGISIVKLEQKKDNILTVSSIDTLDNTPLIDIKPYVPKFDFRENVNNGWLDQKAIRAKPPGRE